MDTDAHDTPGERLRALVDARWTRKQGGIKGLAARLHVSTETMYEWFRNDREPNLDHLTRLGEALGVSRYEIVATMDGEGPVVRLDDELRRVLRDEIESVLDERIGPRRAEPGSSAA